MEIKGHNLKVAFFQKVRFALQISKSRKKNIPKNLKFKIPAHNLILFWADSDQLKLIEIASNWIRLIILLKSDKIGLNWIKSDQVGSKKINMNQIDCLDKTGSNEIRRNIKIWSNQD